MQTHVVGQVNVKCVMGDSSDVELPSDDGGLPPACLMGLRVSFLDFRESFISEVSYLFLLFLCVFAVLVHQSWRYCAKCMNQGFAGR